MIRVYSQQDCKNCADTKNKLKDRGIEFEEVDISKLLDGEVKDVEAMSYIMAIDDSLPVVTRNGVVVENLEEMLYYEQEDSKGPSSRAGETSGCRTCRVGTSGVQGTLF